MSYSFGEQRMLFTLTSESGATVCKRKGRLSAVWASRGSLTKCPILGRCFTRRFRALRQKAPLAMRALPLGCTLIAVATIAPAVVAQKVPLFVDVSKASVKVDRNIFGQFAEHVGHGVYEGIWVGPDSTIPNTRGIRNDIVAALRALKVPNVRWPGGCFADEYHWRNGIGPIGQRAVT